MNTPRLSSLALMMLSCTLFQPSASVAQTNGVLRIYTAYELDYPTEIAKIYQLQGSTNMTAWTNVGVEHVGTGSNFTLLYSGRGRSNHFFRVLVGDSLTNGLVCHYRLNGDANDSSGNGLNGFLTGATGNTNRVGSAGQAVFFDGIDDYMLIPDYSQMRITNRLSIAAWIQFQVGGDSSPRVFYKHGSYVLSVSSTASPANFSFTCYPNGVERTVTSATTYQTGKWYHVVGVYDGIGLKLYVNGAQVSSLSATGFLSTSTRPSTIGRNEFLGFEHYRGAVDELRIYNRDLSPVEVGALYLLP